MKLSDELHLLWFSFNFVILNASFEISVELEVLVPLGPPVVVLSGVESILKF